MFVVAIALVRQQRLGKYAAIIATARAVDRDAGSARSASRAPESRNPCRDRHRIGRDGVSAWGCGNFRLVHLDRARINLVETELAGGACAAGSEEAVVAGVERDFITSAASLGEFGPDEPGPRVHDLFGSGVAAQEEFRVETDCQAMRIATRCRNVPHDPNIVRIAAR